MVKFSEGEWFNIAGKGKVYACKVRQTISMDQISNQLVKIDGVEYFVSGVEYLSESKLKVGSSIGLQVRETKG